MRYFHLFIVCLLIARCPPIRQVGMELANPEYQAILLFENGLFMVVRFSAAPFEPFVVN